MKAILVIMLCVMTLHAEARSSKSDEINKYIVDGKAVSSFDGSQLKGKIIADYSVKTEKQGKEVVNTHVITTKTIEQPIIIEGGAPNINPSGIVYGIKVQDENGQKIMVPQENIEDLLFIVDGVVSIDKQIPANISRIEILKDSLSLVKKYGESAKNGVINITTKKWEKLRMPRTLYVVNDKVVDESDFKSLSPQLILSMDVIHGKGINKYLEKYKVENKEIDTVINVKLRKIRYF